MHLFNNDRLRLLITDVCNIKCLYCHNEGQKEVGNFLPYDFISDFKKWIIKNSVFIRSITISGGEPTLHPDLVKIITTLRPLCEKISMVTNGTILNKKLIVKLKNEGLDYIKFGIDHIRGNSSKTTNDFYHTNINSIIENVLYASEKMPTKLNTVVTTMNYNNLTDILKWCINNKIGIKFLELIEINKKTAKINPIERNCHHEWFFKLHEELRSFLSKSITYNPKLMKFFCTTDNCCDVQFSENFCIFGSCSNLWSRINAKGSLVPCILNEKTIKFEPNNKGVEQIILANGWMNKTNHWPCNKKISIHTNIINMRENSAFGRYNNIEIKGIGSNIGSYNG